MRLLKSDAMTKTLSRLSATTALLALTFPLCVYLLQDQLLALKASATELKQHKAEASVEIEKLKANDALLAQRISTIEKKIDGNTDKLDLIIDRLGKPR